MPRINVNDIQMYYEVHGEGEPLLLVHGGSDDHETWEYVVQALSKNFKVITCDLRGHGDSDKGNLRNYSIKLFADDLKVLLDKLQLEKLHLVGHSMGSAVIERFAFDHPERLRSLTLYGAAMRPPRGMRLFLFMVRFLSVEGFVRRGASIFFYDPTEEEIKKGIARVSKAGKPVLVAVTRASFMMPSFKELPSNLSSISVPVLILFGEKDRTVKQGEEMRKIIPNSKLVVIEHAAHMPHRDRPEEFSKVVLDFCASVKGASLGMWEKQIVERAVA